MYTALGEQSQYTYRIRLEFITRALASKTPQQALFSSQATQLERVFTSTQLEVAHDINLPEYYNPGFWARADRIYNDLGTLRALQINLHIPSGCVLSDTKENMIRRIVRHDLPLLRARSDVRLTLTVEGVLIPWDALGV